MLLIYANKTLPRTKNVWVKQQVRVVYSAPTYESDNPNGP